MADYEVLVAGVGLAGLTAGLFSARYGRSTLVLGGQPGGALLSVAHIPDFPGFPEGVPGYDLCPIVQEQAMVAGAGFGMAGVGALERDGAEWAAMTSDGTVTARSVIVATGSKPRQLGVPGEARLAGRGISHCASCDGPLHRDGIVGVVGGGDSALQEALELTSYVKEVLLFHRGSRFRAQRHYQDRLAESPQISVRLETVVEEILGESRVEGARLRDLSSGDAAVVELRGLFVYVGSAPETAFLDGLLALGPDGHVPTDPWMRTRLPGLYAAGSVRADSAAQAVTAAGDGATAAIAAHRDLDASRCAPSGRSC